MVTSICEMHVHAALFCAGIGTKGIDFLITFPCRIDIFDFGPTGTGRTIGLIPNAKNNRKLSIIGAPGSEPCQRQREKERREKKYEFKSAGCMGLRLAREGIANGLRAQM